MQLQPRLELRCRRGQSVLHGWSDLPQGFFPTCLTHKSHSIALIGSSATMRGMNARPRMVHGPVVLDLLNNYFCTSTGYNRTLNRIFETPPVEIPAQPQELNVPFCNRAKDLRNAAKIFQT